MKKVKVEEMEVRNLLDLVEIVNHNTDSLVRQIKRISKNGRRITLLTGVVAAFAIFSAHQYRKQEEQLYQLSVRVNKLEQSEGE